MTLGIALRSATMGESAKRLREHIGALADFEIEFGEFVSALADYRARGKEQWSTEEYEKRRRAIQKNSSRADRAMRASGLPPFAVRDRAAIGGRVRSTALPSQVFDFESFEEGDLGLSIQRAILDRIPSQIAALEVQLEEAERAGPIPWWRKPGRWDWLEHPLMVAVAGGAVAAVIGGAVLAFVFGIS
jgi:hypothetical protein